MGEYFRAIDAGKRFDFLGGWVERWACEGEQMVSAAQLLEQVIESPRTPAVQFDGQVLLAEDGVDNRELVMALWRILESTPPVPRTAALPLSLPSCSGKPIRSDPDGFAHA